MKARLRRVRSLAHKSDSDKLPPTLGLPPTDSNRHLRANIEKEGRKTGSLLEEKQHSAVIIFQQQHRRRKNTDSHDGET